jgi:uncharacterized membrane protein
MTQRDGSSGVKRYFFLIFLAITMVYGGYNLGRSLLGPQQGEDFAQYYVASRLIVDGEDKKIYDTGETYQERAKMYGVRGVSINDTNIEVMTYAYPPFVAFFMVPFSIVPYDSARYFFFFISIITMFASVPLIFSNREGERKKELVAIGLLTTFLFFPNYYSLYMGQVNSLLFFFCAVVLFFIRKDRPWLAGFFVALASLIKIFPLILIPFFVMKRQYRVVGSTFICIILLTCVSLTVCSLELWGTFFSDVLPVQYSGGAWVRNQGFVGFFTRLLSQNPHVEPLDNAPDLARILAILASTITLISILLCTTREPDQGTFRYEIEFGCYFVAALLVLAKSWEHLGMFLLFSYLYLFDYLTCKYTGKRNPLFLVISSYCVWTFVLTTGIEYEQLPRHVLMNFIISSKFFATLILFGCNLWILSRKGESSLLGRIDFRPSL